MSFAIPFLRSRKLVLLNLQEPLVMIITKAHYFCLVKFLYERICAYDTGLAVSSFQHSFLLFVWHPGRCDLAFQQFLPFDCAEPDVLFQIFECWAAVQIRGKNTPQQILHRLIQSITELALTTANVLIHLLSRWRLKRCLARY